MQPTYNMVAVLRTNSNSTKFPELDNFGYQVSFVFFQAVIGDDKREQRLALCCSGLLLCLGNDISTSTTDNGDSSKTEILYITVILIRVIFSFGSWGWYPDKWGQQSNLDTIAIHVIITYLNFALWKTIDLLTVSSKVRTDGVIISNWFQTPLINRCYSNTTLHAFPRGNVWGNRGTYPLKIHGSARWKRNKWNRWTVLRFRSAMLC